MALQSSAYEEQPDKTQLKMMDGRRNWKEIKAAERREKKDAKPRGGQGHKHSVKGGAQNQEAAKAAMGSVSRRK